MNKHTNSLGFIFFIHTIKNEWRNDKCALFFIFEQYFWKSKIEICSKFFNNYIKNYAKNPFNTYKWRHVKLNLVSALL